MGFFENQNYLPISTTPLSLDCILVEVEITETT